MTEEPLKVRVDTIAEESFPFSPSRHCLISTIFSCSTIYIAEFVAPCSDDCPHLPLMLVSSIIEGLNTKEKKNCSGI